MKGFLKTGCVKDKGFGQNLITAQNPYLCR